MADTALTEEEIDAATAVMRSGALRQGEKCAAFETAFAQWTGARHAMTCSNGSAALHLAYMSILEPGDEVLCPSFTFIATASMVNAAGGRPVFCDVDRHTHLIDLDHAETLLTERTKAIAPVHLFGNSVDVDAVRTFANRHGLKIVWDAAQAHGTLWDGQDVGAFADLVTWSFYPTKNMFTGEGGMVATYDDELDQRLRLLRSHGVQGRYNHVAIGLNYRLTDIAAAIGLVQMGLVNERLAKRRDHGLRLTKALNETGAFQVQEPTDKASHSFHQLCATLDSDASGISREHFMNLMAERGVSTGIHYPRGLHQQPVYIDLYGQSSLAVTEELAANIVAFPVHHGLSNDDVSYIIDATTASLGEL